MSVTTSYMVIVAGVEYKDPMRGVNQELYWADKERHQQFEQCPMNEAGGSKYFTTEVWAACFNHLTPDVIEQALIGGEWNRPDQVFVFWDPEDFYLSYKKGEFGAVETMEPASVRTIAEMRSASEA